MAVEIPFPVDLPPSLRKRFYEPLIFLCCLKDVFNENNQTDSSVRIRESIDVADGSRQQMYFHFVNKLAQICVAKKSPDTITAFSILHPGSIRYLFASNNRKESALEDVKDYITDILTMLHDASDEDINSPYHGGHLGTDDSPSLYSRVLRKILRFNRHIIEFYAKNMANELRNCIELAQDSQESDALDAQAVIDNFRDLEPLVQFAVRDPDDKKPKINIDDFVNVCEKLLYAIDKCYRTSIEDFVRKKANSAPARDGSVETPWGAIHHAIGRLMSYFFAVKILIGTRKLWPELFNDFTVESIPSGGRGDTPDIRRSMGGIVARLTNDKAVLAKYRRHEAQLKQWGIDTKIKNFTHPRGFQPIIHAEVLVDAFIRREERQDASTPDLEPLHFFGEEEFGRYIGASKPTCKLCAMYFAEHPDGIQVRPSHGNIYHNWRPADVFESDGVEVEDQRKAVLEAMVRGLRAETFRCIKKQSAIRNRFDSNNTPSDPMWGAGPTSSIAAMLEGISLEGSTTMSSRENNPEFDRIENVVRQYKSQYVQAQIGDGGGGGGGGGGSSSVEREIQGSIVKDSEKIIKQENGNQNGGTPVSAGLGWGFKWFRSMMA